MRNSEAVRGHDGLKRLAWIILAVSFFAVLLLARPAESHAAVVCPSGTENLLPPDKTQCRPVCEEPSSLLTAESAPLGAGTFAATARNAYDPAPYDFKGDPECAVPLSPGTTWDVKKFCAQNAQFHCLHWHTYLPLTVGSPIPATALVTATPTAAPAPPSYFLGWSSNCAPSPKTTVNRTVCSIVMDAPKTVTATFDTTADTNPPSAPTLTVPVVKANEVQLSWTASTDDWLVGYEIYRNDVLFSRVGPAATAVTFKDKIFCQTNYTWEVRAFDSTNETASNQVTKKTGKCVAAKPPNTVFHLCVVGRFSQCGRTRTVRTTSARTAFFHWGANRARVRYQCRLDSKPWKKCFPGKTYRGLKPGKHVFRVRAYDAAGKDKTPATYRWTIKP